MYSRLRRKGKQVCCDGFEIELFVEDPAYTRGPARKTGAADREPAPGLNARCTGAIGLHITGPPLR